MFHSKHAAAALHAAARAVSGGPVYVSDRPGRHDFALLRRLVLPDGAVLRARLPGRPTADCLFADVSRDGATALKVWTMNAVSGCVGVFNVQGGSFDRRRRAFYTHDAAPGALGAEVRPRDVPPLAGAAERFALWSDATRALTLAAAAGPGLALRVAGGGGHDVVTISPVQEAAGVLFAPIGLVGMLNAGGAVLSSAFAPAEGGGGDGDGGNGGVPVAALRVRGAGAFVAYASHRPTRVAVAGVDVPFEYDAAQVLLRFELPAEELGARDAAVHF
jgi:raffinose synthase